MRNLAASSVVSLSLLATSLVAQASVGPDVTVSSLTDVGGYGQNAANTISAFAVGTVACNVGTQPVTWIAGNNQHPVIAQNMYMYANGRFRQIGMSWLKHAFSSTNSGGCGTCIQPPNGGAQLGVGCSDAYGSGLNGNQGGLGPRSEVNATTGVYTFPHLIPAGDPTIAGRLQVANADLGNAAAQYFVEAEYITADDAFAGNATNNATWQRINTPAVGAPNASFNGAVHAQQPAIYAWQAIDPAVVITTYDIDGRFFIGKRATPLGGGNYHWEVAVQNLNSDRSGGGFTVNFAPGTLITNAGFRSIPYHSGGPYANTPWAITITGSSIHWECPHTSRYENALRWGTMDNFWFDATAASDVSEVIDPFKPTTACPADPSAVTPQTYVLNAAAPFDNPLLTSPSNATIGDDVSTLVQLGFGFTFYGATYTNAYVCSNGFLSFTSNATTYANTGLPNAGAPGACICAYWDDLYQAPGTITYQTLGAAPNRRFVAFWNGVGHYGNTSLIESFKVILDETTNRITTSIISSMDGGASATRGIQNPTGSAGIQASFNAAGSALAGTSQTYTPALAIPPSAALTVTGSTGPNGVLTWSINANAGGPVILVATLDPGPVNLGALGLLNVGLTPGQYYVVADGTGAFQAANPGAATDWWCGDYSISVPLGPGGLPPGLTIFNQGVVITPSSLPPPPNGQFHITSAVTINT